MTTKEKGRRPPPAVGDSVRLRGREPKGVLLAVNEETNWCRVDWRSQEIGPKLCHLLELERLP